MLNLHDGGGILGAQEVAGVVDAGDEVKGVLFQLQQVSGLGDAGVADQYVQAPEALHRLLDHRGDAGLVGYVHLNGSGVLAQGFGHGLRPRQVHVGDDHRRALAVHLLGDTLAKALGRAGHDGDFARQTPLGRGTLADVFPGNALPLAHIYHFSQSFHAFMRSISQHIILDTAVKCKRRRAPIASFPGL